MKHWNIQKFFLFTLLCLSMVFFLGGCGKSPALLRYDISSPPQSLDPQFATRPVEQMVIQNINEGLVRQLPDGQIVLALAEKYEKNEASTQYTFWLNQSAKWENGDPVTAHDFVFAFQRMFNAVSASPHAQNFLAISGAQQVLNGLADVSALGVTAQDDNTLVFTLSQADPNFLEQLCRPAAFPCNEKFFAESHGKYGTSAKMTLSNGPFFIRLWDNSSHLYLKRNTHYYDADQVVLPGVYLYIGRDSKMVQQEDGTETAPPTIYERVLDGTSDVAPATFQQALAAQQQGCTFTTQSNTVWGLVANPNHAVFSQEKMRCAFFHAINPLELEGYLQENMTTTNRIISPEVMQFTENYVQAVPISGNSYRPQQAQAEYEAALPNTNRNALESLELLVPDEANVPFMSGMIQQMWERTLSAFVNIVALPRAELEQRIAAGDYDLAITPFSSTENTPLEVLGQFYSGDGANAWGYHDEEYNALYSAAAKAQTKETRLPALEQAETYLYESCAVVPLFYETTCIVFAPDVTGIELYPYSSMVYFKNAQAYR